MRTRGFVESGWIVERILGVTAVLLLVGGGAGWAPISLGQESANYRMKRISLVSGARATSSNHFSTTVVVGEDQPGGVSSRCNSGFRTRVGFWSLLGDVTVPVDLRLGKTTDDPLSIELQWTGTQDGFEVYRSPWADDLLDPSHRIATTNLCAGWDDPAATPDLVFYKVLPTTGR